mgnify:CR=1 FL=1
MELERKWEQELHRIKVNYIIPIWNWSITFLFLYTLKSNIITLFLYGIGAIPGTKLLPPLVYYIIPIWNWSAVNSLFRYSEYFLLHYSYMELEPCAI